MKKKNGQKSVAIVGAGLGGALCACFFAKHDFQVHLFELRSDIRQQEKVKGRSINMALSRRGRDALAYVGCEEMVLQHGIPMRARMIHDQDAHTHPVPYGIYPDQYIVSIDRRDLNVLLLEEASKRENISLHFEHKFISWDSEAKTVSFFDGQRQQVEYNVDALIGYDGCHSAVRNAMMKTDTVNFAQEYIDSHYMEFTIPPTDNDEYAMEANYLHIWPRHSFMLIALPNADKSFTTTLFLPLSVFEALAARSEDTDALLSFFQTYFPDAISFIGVKALSSTFFSSQPLPLLSIKCAPHASRKGDILLMGDAAHSMAPFYAQGMNSAFEDCLVLFEQLKESNFEDLPSAFLNYDRVRVHDAHAMVDLSLYNYKEMSHLVTQRSFLWRKKLDNLLYACLPRFWIPLYTMVTFTRLPYTQCIALKQRQDRVLKYTRGLFYTLTGLYVLKQVTLQVLKPLAVKFLVRKVLPRIVADQVV